MSSGTRVGTGQSRSRDAAKAGAEAVAQALEAMDGRKPDLILLFATAGFEQDRLVQAVSDAAQRAPIIGCSGEGVIGALGSDEGSHGVALAAIASDELTFHPLSITGLSKDSRACATELARRVCELPGDARLLLLFPDGVTAHFAGFFETLDAALPPSIMVAGGSAGDMLRFERTYQYAGAEVRSDSLSALVISGSVDPQLVISHGCGLIGSEQTVTRAAEGELLEINHEPAWEYFRRYLPEETQSLNGMHVAHLVVAERVGDSGEGFGDLLIRVPLRLDAERGSLFFAAGISPGTTIQMALRDAAMVARRGEEAARELRSRREEEPLLVIELNCAGRGRLLFGDAANELLIGPQQRAFGGKVPWVGLHTYGEIAPVGGRTRFHNYTGVLCALYRSR